MNIKNKSNARRIAQLEAKLPPRSASQHIIELPNISRADAIQNARQLKASDVLFFPASGDIECIALPCKRAEKTVFAYEAGGPSDSQLERLVAALEKTDAAK